MKHTRVQTPMGTRDFLPHDCARKRHLEHVISETFLQWGYSEVDTPTMEYQDVVLLGQGGTKDENMYKLFDREGNTLVLRPDMTMPIGRLAATRLKHLSLPYRLSYITNVFRYTGVETGRQREFHQAGTELIGASGPSADAEVIALANEVFTKTGLQGVTFDIGHVGFVHGLLDAASLSDTERTAILYALIDKDFVSLANILQAANTDTSQNSSLTKQSIEALRALPQLRGNVSKVVNEALALVKDIEESTRALYEIRDVVRHLDDYGLADSVNVDLGMIKDFDYYTGVTMEAYAKGFGAALCSGGRYDNLAGHFGESRPATGFALGVEWLMAALERQGEVNSGITIEPDMIAVIPDSPSYNYKSAGLALVKRLRTVGIRVMLELIDRPIAQTKAFANERGASWLLTPKESQVASCCDAVRWELLNLATGHSHEVLSHDHVESIMRGEHMSCPTGDTSL